MESSWTVIPLGECGEWYSGGTPDTGMTAYWNGDIPWISASSLHDFYIRDSERRVTQLGLENGTRLMPAQTILFVVRGMSLKTEFRVGIAQRPVAFGQDCKAIIVRAGIDPTFLAYSLRARAPEILSIADEASHGTGRLQTEALQQLEIDFPPLPEQRAIAAVLGALDDKIELNRRMNATLEGMARALFKSWFVDFDPVRAKMAGRATGLPEEMEGLFPAEMEEGRPKGWEAKSLDEIATYLNGLALQKYPALGEDFLPVIKIAQLRKGSTEGADRASIAIPHDYIIEDGDILFSWSGSLDVVIWSGGRGALNQHLFKVTSDQYPKWFYYLWTEEHLTDFQDIAAGKATTMGHIQRRHLTQAKAFVPSDDLLQTMDVVLSPLIERIVTNNVESRTLATLRDTLLPKLMAGEVRVSHLENLFGVV